MKDSLLREELKPLLSEGAQPQYTSETASSRNRVTCLPLRSDERTGTDTHQRRRSQRYQVAENLCFWLVYAALLMSSIAWALMSSLPRFRQYLPSGKMPASEGVASLRTMRCKSCDLSWREPVDGHNWPCSLKLRSRATLGHAVSESVPVSALQSVRRLCPKWRKNLLYPGKCREDKHPAARCSTFLWISDLHIDLWFDPDTASSTFGELKVCRQPEFVYKDALGERIDLRPQSLKSGKSTAFVFAYGRSGCDPPFRLLESLTEAMRQVDSEPDFVLLTGDIAPHYLPSRSFVLESIRAVAQHLSTNLSGSRTGRLGSAQKRPKFIISVGNVDLFPTLYLPEKINGAFAINANLSEDSSAVLLKDLYSIYSDAGLIDSDDEALRRSFSKGGYYRAYDDGELRVLVYNSLLYISDRLFRTHYPGENRSESQIKEYLTLPCERWAEVLPDADDPANQFSWLDHELADAAHDGRSVFLVSHIGPGSKLGARSWCEPYAKRFVSLLGKYNGTVSMQLYGDLPREEMRLIDSFNSSSNTRSSFGLPMLMNPGLTPRRLPGGAPTFRHGFLFRTATQVPRANGSTYDVHKKSLVTLLDFHAYAFPLHQTAAERYVFGSKALSPEWRWRYSFRDQYCVENISADAMNDLVRKMKGDSDLMEAYMLRMNDGFEASIDIDWALQMLRFHA
jgi:hypothetical protein